MKESEMVKVQFYDPAIGYENIWAAPVGDGTYRLENPPFFIYGISLADIVSASQNNDGLLQFLTVVKRSGNVTLRARSKALIGDSALRTCIEDHLKQMGCEVEVHRERLLAISVPPTVRIPEVTSYLTEMELSWEYGCPSERNT
ncbi:MAG TPA: DUF4265 domain-containing protein [Candidatus Acidoferrales bacterium]|nr:DUF4265 domain-containing protein [Candidatus Acidoferrales bacterium]